MIAGLCESLNAIVETGATVRLIRVRIGATWPRANALDQTRGDSHLEGELLRNGARRLRPGVSEDARVPVPLFSETGITTVFTNLDGFLEDWKENPKACVRFVREYQCPASWSTPSTRT